MNTETLAKRTVSQIVARNFKTATVFRSFDIDFCCGGNITLEKACEKKGLDPTEVYEALVTVMEQEEAEHHYDQWSPEFLMEYIINNHHSYVRSRLPEIHAYAQKVAKVHGDRHPELNKIQQLVNQLKPDILEHLDKEEKDVFPYIRKLVNGTSGEFSNEDQHFEYGEHPVTVMEEEHDEAGHIMREIQRLSDNFTPPADACTTYRLLYENLEDFQKDLHKHVHLENNILFPKALELEE